MHDFDRNQTDSCDTLTVDSGEPTGKSAIEILLQRYFDLLYTCDLSLFDEVFHSNVQLQAVLGGTYNCLSATDYADVLRTRISPQSQGAERRDQVLTIDQSSEHSAVAKVTVLINGQRYCDYLSLLRIDGRWSIVAKVYCTQ